MNTTTMTKTERIELSRSMLSLDLTEQIKAWETVLNMVETIDDETELNKFYRSLTNDAAWKTKTQLIRFIQWKVAGSP